MKTGNMRAVTIRTFLPGMICALCAVSFMPSTAAEPDTDGQDVLTVVRSRDKTAIRSDTVSVPVPPAGTRVDSVLATVNGEPITMLDVILETGSQEKELAGI